MPMSEDNKWTEPACMVPNSRKHWTKKKNGVCGGVYHIGWACFGIGGGVCEDCHEHHCDDDDQFTLRHAFDIPAQETVAPFPFEDMGVKNPKKCTAPRKPKPKKRTPIKRPVESNTVKDDLIDDILDGIL